METKTVNEDSKYLYYLADNKSQFTSMEAAFNKLGGTKFCTYELRNALDFEEWAIIISSVFVVVPPSEKRIRSFLGHGVSDKPIAKFIEPQNYTAEDYYFSAGPKMAWLYHYYSHRLETPYPKELKIGVPDSDYFLNEKMRLNKKTIKAKHGIENGNKPIVLYSPSFNSKSMEFYHRLFIEMFKDEYYLIFRSHDREAYKSPHTFENVYYYHGLDNPVELISIADYYIGEGSSVDNLAIFADIPIILTRPLNEIASMAPYEFDMKNFCSYYAHDPQAKEPTLRDVIKDSDKPEWREKRQKYIANSFYYTDGRCTERFLNAIKKMVEILKWRQAGRRDIRSEEMVKIWQRWLQSQGLSPDEHKKTTDIIDYEDFFTELT